MPPKKEKGDVKVRLPSRSKSTMDSDSSLEIKPKKQKPLTKKEKEKIKRMENEMKEELMKMKTEAEAMLADYKAMEETAIRKAQLEDEQHTARVEILSRTCETFNTAKLRLVHEHNKIREEEIWRRYITTDQKPYPESTPNMYTHLYLWKQHKVTEDIDFALNKCDTYVATLDLLDELIEYPLYSPKETVANWKDLRTEWRREFLDRIDKCCFHMIKNLSKNFKQQLDRDHVYAFHYQTDHLKLGMSAWTENHDILPPLKWTPKITFKAADAEFVMPAAYRQRPFILRLVYLDRDFLSDNSLTNSPPPSMPMEADLLKEINRCFEVKKEAKMSVADREKEKVKAAKQKYLEAQEAANQAEKSFKTLQEQTKEFRTMKSRGDSIKSDEDANETPIPERRKNLNNESLAKQVEPTPDSSRTSNVSKRRPQPDTLGETASTARMLIQSAGALKTLDTISMRSGMRKKQDKGKKTAVQNGLENEESARVFKTRSMISAPEIKAQTIIRKDSALCFEETELSSEGSIKAQKVESLDSLDLMLGRGDEEDNSDVNIPTLRQLIRNTVIVEHPTKQPRVASKTMPTFYSLEGKKRRARGKSMASVDKKLNGENLEEIPPTASDIFETHEDARQEQYLTSLYFQTIPGKHYHLNLRIYSIVSGTYILDIISHVSQPHLLANGTSVQIFYGEMNIRKDVYEYKYTPPPPPGPDDDPDDLLPDHGLQHLLHVKIPLPRNVVYFQPPVIALWDREDEYWTNEHVHKLEIDKETNIARFSLGKIMPFAFCLNKFSLLPYVSWTLKPKFDTGGVSLTISSTFATIEFHVLNFKVSLTKAVTHEEENIIQVGDIVGKEMYLHKLIAVMKSRGINVFPDEDACLYTENSAKDVVLEEHTNLCIAMWSDNLEFHWCEWNGDFKRRKLAFRVREYMAYNLELRYRTVVASCLSATIYRLGVEDTAFDESKVETYGFCPDVLNLLEKAFLHVDSSRPVNPLQVLAVYSLLCRTKLHSYSGVSRKETLSSSSESSRKGIKKRQKKTGQPKNRKAPTPAKTSGDDSVNISERSSSVFLYS